LPPNLLLGKEFPTRVLTGPNPAGKPGTLTTVGICVLMAQTGLHIPVMEESEICVYKNNFDDIGDEQSIEQSLSTISTHMV
ncbi:endonuclease MutS2, partial [Bacillus cereus]|nr:endonuclease MutS2 [Bacillus cereus]